MKITKEDIDSVKSSLIDIREILTEIRDLLDTRDTVSYGGTQGMSSSLQGKDDE